MVFFGQLSMILNEIFFCLGSYLTVNIQPFATLDVKPGWYIFFPKCLNSYLTTYQLTDEL